MALGPFTKQDHLEITTLWMEFAVSEILGAGAGYWLDQRWGTSPWMLLAGAGAGFALGLYQVIRGAGQMSRKKTNLRKVEKEDGRR